MYKVLIVEDEWFTRNSFVNSIDWGSAGCKVVADAEEGRQALKLIELHRPDIVVSDIRMDDIDGLELCEEINKRYPDIRVILVTGYSEFEYAQQALKLGVKDFILKPTDPNKLLDAARGAAAEIQSLRNRQAEYLRLQAIVEDSIPLFREKFILELANGRLFDEKELNQKQEFLSMDFQGYFILALEIDDYEEQLDRFDEKHRQVVKLALRDTAVEIMKKSGGGYFIEKESNLFLIFAQCLNKEELAEQLQMKIAEAAQVSVSIGVSDSFIGPENIDNACFQAIEALRRKFFIGRQSIIFYKDIKTDNDPDSIILQSDIDILIVRMMSKVKLGNSDGALADLEYIFEKLSKLKADYIKNIAIEIIVLLQRHLLDMGENNSTIFQSVNILTWISDCNVMADIKNALQKAVIGVSEMTADRSNMLSRSVVEKIMDYLNKNFNRNISLEDLSNIAFMNPKYICRLIKKETGSNFSEILLGIRIEKAKELLRKADMKTYEIAEKIGIEDPQYFSKVFKKHTGVTPSEYRQQLSKTFKKI